MILKKGCPICNGDLKGNDTYKYLCLCCCVLFDKKHVTGNIFSMETKTMGYF